MKRKKGEISRSLIAKSRRGRRRECPNCGYEGTFVHFGDPPRWDARCPSCGSLERHRLLALLLRRRPDLLKAKAVLHFAPESCISGVLQKGGGRYVTADISGQADLTLNIEMIDLPDASFDVVFCSHVLEHVNDLKALRELRRILTQGGTLFAMVPIVEGWQETFEDESVTSEADRDLHFGQWDHVRYYGSDFRMRLKDAGFVAEDYTAFGHDVARYGLERGEKVFICRKE
jgi:SAM-dependent methyltransferase